MTEICGESSDAGFARKASPESRRYGAAPMVADSGAIDAGGTRSTPLPAFEGTNCDRYTTGEGLGWRQVHPRAGLPSLNHYRPPLRGWDRRQGPANPSLCKGGERRCSAAGRDTGREGLLRESETERRDGRMVAVPQSGIRLLLPASAQVRTRLALDAAFSRPSRLRNQQLTAKRRAKCP